MLDFLQGLAYGLLVSCMPWLMAGMLDPRLALPEEVAKRWQVILRYGFVAPFIGVLLFLTSLWGGFGASLGGWLAGLFHLITHAFFKSLLFLFSGSVIHAVHSNDMRVMGGLRKKMPITAYTMLIGCLAIAGIGAPFLAGFSGFHWKDLIVEQALIHWNTNTGKVALTSLLFTVPLFTAGLTAFYMFRLWFMTFAGEPRDHHVYEHAHESPWVMTVPLVVLSLFAAFVAAGGEKGPLFQLLVAAEPAGVAGGFEATGPGEIALPGHAAIAARHTTAGAYDITIAVTGTPGDTETTLTSVPTLPEPDIMAMLVTGRTLDDMRG